MLAALIAGFLLGGSLIIAIGAQNAYVLQLGLMRKHVFAAVLFCAVSDAILIFLGVAGFGEAIKAAPVLLKAVMWGGAAFLFWYGLSAFKRALSPSQLQTVGDKNISLQSALAQCAAFTWLNPHVYLDTVILVGGISTSFGDNRWWYAMGAAVASFVWFFSLGYGARLLTPLFAKPVAWRVLDTGIGCVMWGLAIKLLLTPL